MIKQFLCNCRDDYKFYRRGAQAKQSPGFLHEVSCYGDEDSERMMKHEYEICCNR